jgi:hypothetical protein
MTELTSEEMERAEIEMLLPWYATGRLGRADMERVETYLARNPDVARQLELVRDEQAQTVSANEALGWPSAGALDRLMAALPGTAPGGARQRAGAPLLRRIGALFTVPTARGVRWAAAGAAALIAVQAVTIAALLLRERGGTTYQTASGQQTAGEGVSALVVFTDEATAPAISRLLSEFRGKIVDGPRSGGVYKIRLRLDDRSQGEAQLKRLEERRDLVRVVRPTRD